LTLTSPGRFIRRLTERTLYSIAEIVQSSTWLKGVALEALRILGLEDAVVEIQPNTSVARPGFSQFVYELFPSAGVDPSAMEKSKVWVGRQGKNGQIQYSLIKDSGSSHWDFQGSLRQRNDRTDANLSVDLAISANSKPELEDLVVVLGDTGSAPEGLVKMLALAHLSVAHLSIASVHSIRSTALQVKQAVAGSPRSGLVWVEDIKLINPSFFTVRYELLQRLNGETKNEIPLIAALVSSAHEERLHALVGLTNAPENALRTVDESFVELSSNLPTRFHLPLLYAKQRLEKIQTLLLKEPPKFLGSAVILQINGVSGGGVKKLADSSQTESTVSLAPSSRALLLTYPGSEPVRIDLPAPFDPWCETDPRLSLIVSEIALTLEVATIRFEHFLFISPGTLDAIFWLGIDTEFVAHDFYLLCPSPHLLDDKLNSCFGNCTPGNGSCQTVSLITKQDTFAELKNQDVHIWRKMWGPRIERLSRINFLSRFTERQFLEVYPQANSNYLNQVAEASRFQDAFPGFKGGKMRVILAGDIGPHKGALLFRSLAPAMARMGIELTVLGRIWVGAGRDGLKCIPYEGPDELRKLIGQIKPHLALIPSRAPETFSLVLSEMWESGIPVLASRIGALEERISQHGGGFLIDDFTSASAWELALTDILNSPESLETAHQQICARYKANAN